MKKLVIIGIGVMLLGFFALATSCEKEGDDGYVSCSNTCSATQPYSNANTSSCYATQSACETATGEDCKDCN